MQQINLPSGNYLAVIVPEDAKNFTIIESHSYFKSPRIEHSIGGIDIPKDKDWEIIGKADEIDLDDLPEPIVEYKTDLELDTWFKNYEDDTAWFLDNEKASFLSLLQSYNLKPSETLIIKQLNHPLKH